MYSGNLAQGVQLRAPPQLAGLPHAQELKLAFANHNHQPNRDSSYEWVRYRGQVSRMNYLCMEPPVVKWGAEDVIGVRLSCLTDEGSV